MGNPQNYRAYGVLLRNRTVLVAAEHVDGLFVWKYPGGGVADHETAEEALVREFREETQLEISIVAELHDPGTLISPWTRKAYTPVYFLVDSPGEPRVPEGEEIEMTFMQPGQVLESDLVAAPEKAALRTALALHGESAGRGQRRRSSKV